MFLMSKWKSTRYKCSVIASSMALKPNRLLLGWTFIFCHWWALPPREASLSLPSTMLREGLKRPLWEVEPISVFCVASECGFSLSSYGGLSVYLTFQKKCRYPPTYTTFNIETIIRLYLLLVNFRDNFGKMLSMC